MADAPIRHLGPAAAAPARGLALVLVRAIGRGLGALPRPIAAAAAIGWMVLIWWLSSGPIDVTPPLPAADFFWNLAHAPVFGVLAAFAAVAFARRPLPATWPDPGPRACLLALALVAAWAGLDELHQSQVSGRHGSLFDFATDVVGAVAVLWIAGYAGRAAASERGLRWRLALAAGVCAVAALATTLADRAA